MAIKRLMFGTGVASPVLYEANNGYLDGATKYDALAKTDPVAPAGAAGECAFHNVYVYVLHEVAVPIIVTVFIDGTQVATKTTTLTLPSSRKRRIIKVPIIKRFPSSITGFATSSSFAARGVWAQVQVETSWGSNTPGFVRVEGIELERTILTVSSLVAGSNK